jgi:drug/metabolite transporter (DMT)-like permease
MISFSPVFVKLAHVGPTVAGFYRMLFGGLILTALAGFNRRSFSRNSGSLLLMGACGIFFTLDLSFWHRSIHYVGPGLATLLSNFQVFFLTAYGLIALRERPNWRLGAAVPMAMVGLYLIVGPAWDLLPGEYKRGVFFGGITALCYSAYLLALRGVQTEPTAPSSAANLAFISLSASLLLGAEAWIQGESFRIPDLTSWTALAGYGLISQVLGWLLISRGMVYLQAGQVGLILLLQPTLAFVWDVILFQRPTALREVVGAVVALIAIHLGTTRRQSA